MTVRGRGGGWMEGWMRGGKMRRDAMLAGCEVHGERVSDRQREQVNKETEAGGER